MNLSRIAVRSFSPSLFVFCIALSSCGGPLPGIATVEFIFESGPEFRAAPATITPDLPFDIVTYSIRGSGPDVGNGPLEFEVITSENRHIIDALVFGAWEIEVAGLNAIGDMLVSGRSLVDIASAGTITIELGPVEGLGTLSISVEANRIPPDSSLLAVATDSEGAEITLEAIPSEGGFAVTGELAAGSYVVEFTMRDAAGETMSGAVEAIFILGNFETSGIVQIAMLPAPEGEITLEIDSGVSLPKPAVIIVESGAPLFIGDDVTARLETAEPAGSEVSWFLSGSRVDPLLLSGNRFLTRIDTPGLYRIDAILSIDGNTSASDSAIIEIIDPYLYGPYAYVTTQRDNINRVDGISGARDCVVHPSGSALYVAGYSESSIGYFAIDETDLKPNFVAKFAAPGLAGVTDLSVNVSGSTLAAAGSKNDLVCIVALDGGVPEGISTIDPAGPEEAPISGVVGVAFAPDDRLYVLASGSNSLLEYSLDGSDASLVLFVDLSSIEGATISEPLSLSVSPEGAWVAISAKGSDSITIFDRTGGLSVPVAHFVDGVNGVEHLNGGGGMAFTRDGTTLFAVAYYDDAVSRFDFGENGWRYTGAVQNEESGSFGFHYPRDVAIASDNDNLAVASSGDDAVAFFSVASSASGGDPLPVFIDAAVNGIGRVTGFDGARSIAMHPTGGAIYVASSNDSSIATFVER